ncbi:unnamed protein product [Lepidochelys olivacea]
MLLSYVTISSRLICTQCCQFSSQAQKHTTKDRLVASNQKCCSSCQELASQNLNKQWQDTNAAGAKAGIVAGGDKGEVVEEDIEGVEGRNTVEEGEVAEVDRGGEAVGGGEGQGGGG